MHPSRIFLILAGIFGLTGIVLGALGAHALEETLRMRDTTVAWETAVRYHFFHTAALLAAGVWMRIESVSRIARFAAWSWVSGILLFCGTLYILALGGPGILRPVTPIGGLLFMVGWAAFGVAAWRTSSK